jgi:hypothetical protein
MMSYEIDVLRALARLQRRRLGVDEAALAMRVGGDRARVRCALRVLARAELVENTKVGVRLTMAGLVVAVAMRPARIVIHPARDRRARGVHQGAGRACRGNRAA